MRQNLPVSSVEFLLDEGKPIVAKTDLHGNIVYVNPYFVEVSGYSEQELLGAPHNIVRHPDMPSAAFADLWATLQSGLPWSGLLKNRRKNGDFYWVEASITPVLENGKAVGYVSVRTRPARAQVQAAAAAYRSIAAGNPGRLTIRQGQVQRSDWRGLWPAVKNLSTEGRAIVALATICAMLLGGGGAGALLVGGRRRLRGDFDRRAVAWAAGLVRQAAARRDQGRAHHRQRRAGRQAGHTPSRRCRPAAARDAANEFESCGDHR